jgi:uncharacterized LabA/DUF88 family protein
MSNKDQRIGVFLDIQNLYHSAKNLYGAKVNFPQLLKHVVGNRQLIRAIGYVVKSDVSLNEASFFEALEKAGIELRMKDLQIFPGGMKKADWDVGLAVDAIRLAPSLDVAVLVSGDGDFVPLVNYLKWSQGCKVEVVSFSRTTSAKLREAGDEHVNVEEIPNIFIRNKQKKK